MPDPNDAPYYGLQMESQAARAKNYWVIGDAAGTPWLLMLEPVTEGAAQQAIAWQRVGQGHFDPPDYWRVVTTEELRSLLPTMGRSPYTAEAWARVVERVNG